MNILLTGSTGQLGKEIINNAPKNINLICPNRNKLDLTDFNACFNFVINKKPDWIINAGAYTKVDDAEVNKELTISTNAECPLAFSKALKLTGGKILQISTDYVFDGNQSQPYSINHKKSPVNFYGESKSLAEDNILSVFGEQKKYLILRTSWVMGRHGNNFLLTMLSLHLNKDIIKVVSDQIGAVTSSSSLAKACWQAIKNFSNDKFHQNNTPILHFTDIGETSWYEVALEIGKNALNYGLISKCAQIEPVMTYEYKKLAKRPKYSVLDCTQTYQLLNLKPLHWRNSIEDIIKKIK